MEGEEGSLSIILRSNADGSKFSAHVGGQWRSAEVVNSTLYARAWGVRTSAQVCMCVRIRGLVSFSVRGRV